MRKVFVFLTCALALWSFGWKSVGAQSYFGQSAGTPIYGPELSESDLTGKVVYIEYWGINCGPCRAAFPHLIECQNQYGRSGSFVMIGSHLQEMAPEVTDYLKSINCNFTNYQQYICPLAPPEGGGIPQAYLLDCKGQLIAGGNPSEVLPKVPAAVADAAQRNRLVNGFSPVLDLDVPAPLKKAAMQFTPEKAWASAMAQLEKKAKNNEDAQTLLDGINAAIDSEVAELESMLEERPSEALFRLTQLVKNLKGLPQIEEVNRLGKKAQKIEGAKEMVKVWTQMSVFQKKARTGKVSATAATKETKKVLKVLKEISENKEFHESVRAEADALIAKAEK